MKRFFSFLPVVVAVFFPFVTVQACGPFFFDDVFIRPLRPDHPPQFAGGKLGILLSTYPRADLAVAYRYLDGGTLTPEEQRSYQPTQSFLEYETTGTTDDAKLGRAPDGASYIESLGPADQWLAARNHYAPPPPNIHPVRQFGGIYPAGFFLAGEYENCQADAFRTAVVTLQSRTKSWGAKSPELAGVYCEA
jgi:hypothetical protein